MDEITILSPHRDDAAFSLYLSLSRWSAGKISLRVVNFFTVSSYAPRVKSQDSAVVSSLRGKEDRRVLHSISKNIQIRSLGLLDAPLRLGINVSAVCEIMLEEAQSITEANRLASAIDGYHDGGVVLAPLGLGHHVDHLTVNSAAISCGRLGRVGFYEDLPYATWTEETAIRERVSEIESKTRVPLKPIAIRARNSVRRKLRGISHYRSQITHTEAEAIARFSLKYHGERIWIPKFSGLWNPLIT
ncbi:MAG: PIG-L family deacetylase [Acidobacteriaceae bacterium]|nr:PIG-L family deacetylase [Acidobacteriaceae bacterium]